MGSAARRGGICEREFYFRLAADSAFRAEVDAARLEGRQRRAHELEAILFEGAGRAGKDAKFTGQLIFALTNLDAEHWKNTQHQRVEVEEHVQHDPGPALLAALDEIARGPTDDGPADCPVEGKPVATSGKPTAPTAGMDGGVP